MLVMQVSHEASPPVESPVQDAVRGAVQDAVRGAEHTVAKWALHSRSWDARVTEAEDTQGSK